MRKEIKKAPTIRFQGFTDEWEQHKLGDVCNQLTGAINPQTRPNELFVEYSMPAYDSGMKPNIVYGFTMNSTRKIVNESCLLINKLNVRKKRIWYIKNPTKNTVCSAEFIPLCSDNIDLLFLNYVVSRDAFTNYLEDCSSGSSNSQKRVTPDIIIEAKVFLPVKDEQLRIGRYFQKIDNLITLYQRKLDQLKKLKKYFLQNLFPAKGEKVPRIRFKGFTGDWEQRKLGECCREFKSGSFISASDIKESGEYPVFGGNGLRGYTSEYNHNGEFALIGRQGNLCGNMNYSTGKAYFTEHAIAVQANKFSDTKFMYYLLKKMNLGQYSDQSAQPGLAVGKLINMKASFPSASEQEKIGAYFANIDHLIALHQRKLNQLQTMKKFMLQNLFI